MPAVPDPENPVPTRPAVPAMIDQSSAAPIGSGGAVLSGELSPPPLGFAPLSRPRLLRALSRGVDPARPLTTEDGGVAQYLTAEVLEHQPAPHGRSSCTGGPSGGSPVG